MMNHKLMTDFPINRMMDNFLSTGLGEVLDHVPVARPKTNIVEHDEAYVLEMTVPGMNKDNIQLEVENNTLMVQGSVEERKDDEESPNFYRREFRIGAFKRSFELPKNVDVESIDANYKDGILLIRLPKMEKLESKRLIEIA